MIRNGKKVVSISKSNPSYMEYEKTPLLIDTFTVAFHGLPNRYCQWAVNLNANTLLGDLYKGTTRFDANLSANKNWQDVVIDLNYLIANNILVSSFYMNIDSNGLVS